MTKENLMLICLAEECGEVIQAVTKILRFGLDSKAKEYDDTNREELRKELNDVMAISIKLTNMEVIGNFDDYELIEKKLIKLNKYEQVSTELGILQ